MTFKKIIDIQVVSKRRVISTDYVLHDHHLDIADSSKYLGVQSGTTTLTTQLQGQTELLDSSNVAARARTNEVIIRPKSSEIPTPSIRLTR